MSVIRWAHPEANIDGFTQSDGTIRFYGFVWACILRTRASQVMDYGAGRGAFFYLNTAEKGSLFRRYLQDLRNTGVRVTACDVDAAVLDHPCAHDRVQLTPGRPLPFPENSFDVIVSDHTFEHIRDAPATAAELLRVLRPGGYICARTPSLYGYVALASRVIPNRLHEAVLRRAQPRRMAEDVFPTVYRLNTPAALRRCFTGCTVEHFYHSAEPAYAFDSRLVYGALRLLHRILPGALNTTLYAFIRKPYSESTSPSGERGP